MYTSEDMLQFLRDFLFEEEDTQKAPESLGVTLPGEGADPAAAEQPAGGSFWSGGEPKKLDVTGPETAAPAINLNLADGAGTEVTEPTPFKLEVLETNTEAVADSGVVEPISPSAALTDTHEATQVAPVVMSSVVKPVEAAPAPVEPVEEVVPVAEATPQLTHEEPVREAPVEHKIADSVEDKIAKLKEETEEEAAQLRAKIEESNGEIEAIQSRADADIAAEKAKATELENDLKVVEEKLRQIEKMEAEAEMLKEKTRTVEDEQRQLSDALRAMNSPQHKVEKTDHALAA